MSAYALLTYAVPEQVQMQSVERADTELGNAVVIVRWFRPISDLTVFSYQIMFTPQRSNANINANTLWKNSTSNSVTSSRLEIGITYEVRVRATSTIGFGPWSDAISKKVYANCKLSFLVF